MIIISFTLIIINPYNAILNTFEIKFIFCLISIGIIACISRCLCIYIDHNIDKKYEEIFFTNYRHIDNLNTFLFDYSTDELPTTYGSMNT